MRNFIVLLSLLTASSTIRVPTWNNDGSRQQSIQPHSFSELDVLLTPTNQGWSPVLPPAAINKFYKKPVDRQSYYKKNFISSNPLAQSSTKNVVKNLNVVPYNNFPQNNFFDPFSQISNQQKPQNIPIQHNFQPIFSTNIPQFIQKAESTSIPKKKSHLNDFYNFKPLQDLEQIEDAFGHNKLNKPHYVSHLTKNYRDDKTHEPNQYDPHYEPEEELKVEREEHEIAPISSHEIPAEIPTKPIYPGQGLWAKPGLKHKPFITKQKYDQLEDDKVKPDGYDTFEAGQKLFENKNNAFVQNFPRQHQIATAEQGNIREEEDENEEINEDSDEDEFVPMKLYAQVRESENTEYLPENEDDGRLRESIKEAKVHTVYTEEGYEDSAYDHAGHEKEAASDEGFEDLQREKIEKKEKRPKYNHLPKITTEKFSVGNGVLSDEQIKEIKEEQLGIADAEVAGTRFEEVNSAEEEFSTIKPMKENKNFITTKETKTMMTKEKDNGNTETEYSSKINIVLQPNNSTETHKYEKIYPKVYKTIQRIKTEEPQNPVNFSGIFIEEIISSTATPPTEELLEEIPITTLPTTAIPKPDNLEALSSINKAFLSSRRVKRYSNDFSDLRLNAQFLPPINHELGKVKEDNTLSKYPYYDKYEEKGLNENSPLRYAEDLKNIPNKTGKNLVFYEEAERRVTCPEIRQTVNAIPERVLNAEKNEEEEEDDDENVRKPEKLAEQPKTPRLSGLGDQIDCLKVKYFGENPLDSPIFKEDTIAPPAPIFDIFKRENYNEITNRIKKKINTLKDQFGNKPAPTQNTDKISTNNAIDNDIKTNKIENEKIITTTTTPKSIGITNLLTTPKYTLSLKPKHIYHQIKLLDYLPEDEDTSKEEETEKPQSAKENINLDSSDQHLAIRRVNNGNGPPFLIFDVNKFIPNREIESEEETVDETSRQSKAYDEEKEEAIQPVAEEWRRRKIKKKRPPFQIFDVNKFLPTTPFSIFNENIQTSTVLPKYKVESEVFYKDQIHPNEQLHVLTDILNNIKNSSQEQPPDASIQSSEPVSVTLLGNNKKKPFYRDSYLQAYGEQEVDENYYSSQTTTSTPLPSTSTTTIKPVRRPINYPIRTPVSPAVIKDREEKFKLYLALLEAKKQHHYPTSTINNDYGVTIPVTEKIIEETTKVMGLMPPSNQRYKTMPHLKRDNKKVIEINKFYVIGMRPPPKQKLILYPEFIINKNKHVLMRGKRSTSYASLSRKEKLTEKPIEVVDSEEDDAPHRPKNYYYDEKTGKIVYLTTAKPESEEKEEKEEEVEYEEIVEPATTSKPLQDPVFATATPPPKGKSYVDFVNKLHDISGYKNISDPTTTEKGKEVSTTTLKPESTTPPPFLDILNKIKQNSQYKVIEDKKETKTTTTTESAEKIVEEEEEEEEESLENVQNSPGERINEHYEQLGIFDVTDYIPKIKNYLPKTSYDISKYKTIARSTPKPKTEDDTEKNLDTKEENSDSDSKEEATTKIIKTTQKPFVIITEETASIDSVNEATVNKETEKAPTTLQRRRLKTTSSSTSTERTTTKSSLENRRRRPTTLRSTVTTDTTEKTVELKRNYRRRPVRIQTENPDEDEENTTKVVKRRSDSTGTNTPKIRNKNFVESFKTYHRNKKHGGNYRDNEDSNENSTEIKNATLPRITNNGTVEIVVEYDETKKHGGNYRSEEDVKDEDKNSDDKLVIDLLPKESEEKSDSVETTTVKINLPKRFTKNEKDELPEIVPTRKTVLRGRLSSNKQKNRKNIVTEPTIMRLTDIVPKPESFYKDPTLSKSVNMLESKNIPTNEEIIGILSSTESEERQPEKYNTKKPNIIKDPSKRLYYYAPI